MSDYPVDLAMATLAMEEWYDLTPVAQQTRFGTTAKYIKRQEAWKGSAMHEKLLIQPYTAARMTASLEADTPKASGFKFKDIEISQAYLRRITVPLAFSVAGRMLLAASESPINDLATTLITESKSALDEKIDQALNSSVTLGKSVIGGTPTNADGTAFTPGTTTAFLPLSGGSIASIHCGEFLDIRTVAAATVRCTVQVNDVILDTQWLGNTNGPGIRVTYSAAGADATMNNVAANDVVVANGEGLTDGFDSSFASLGSLGSSPSTYFGIDRRSVGNMFLLPYGRNYAVGGAAQNLVLDTVFANMCATLANLLGPSRSFRVGQGFELTDAIVCQAQQDLIIEAINQATNTNSRFTKEYASTLGEAQRKKLVAWSGFDGLVIRFPFPGIPPLVMETEQLCPANEIRVWDPNSWKIIRMGGKNGTGINWLPAGPNGWIWATSPGTTAGTMSTTLRANGLVYMVPVCDQPQVGLYTIQGVKSSLS